MELGAVAGMVRGCLQRSWTTELDRVDTGLDARPLVAVRRRTSQARRLRHRIDGRATAWRTSRRQRLITIGNSAPFA